MNNYIEDFLDSTETVDGSINRFVVEGQEHILFKKESLINMLRVSSSILNLKSTQVVPRSIVITPRDNHFVMIANNDMEYLEYRFEVLNPNDRLKEPIAIPFDILSPLLKLMSEDVLIYKGLDGYYIRLLLEGDLYLDLPKPEESLIEKPYKDVMSLDFKVENAEKTNAVSSLHLYNGLKSLIPIVEEEIVLDRRRISFNRDKMFYNSSAYSIQYILPLPSFKISLRVAYALKKILQVLPEGPVFFFRDNAMPSRIVVRYKNVEYSSYTTSMVDNKNLYDYLDRVQKYSGLQVEVKDLSKILNIAVGLPYAKKEVKFKYQDELILTVPMKTKESVFKLSSKKIGEDITKKEITVQASRIKKLLDCFSAYENISISFLDSCIIINKGNLIGVLEL
ncbi:MAG: hypothetical protein J6T15_04825 [Bacilli bacterium]|nr:hypothetical protein [Bacilli bacterium]